MPEFTLALLILGAAAGILSGMFGIGGGIVIVPVLLTLFAFDFLSATGTSLAALLMPVGIFGLIAYYRAGKLRLSVAVMVGLGLVLGNWLGANVAFSLPTKTLQMIYGVFLIYVSWRFIEPRQWLAQRGAAEAPPPDEAETSAPFYWLVLIGALAGIASGLFGIGGGLVIVPALVMLLRFDQKVAVGTSLAAQLPPVGLPAVLTYYQQDKLDVAAAALVAGGLIVGSFLGARIAISLSSGTVKRLYGIFLLVVAARFLLNA